MLVHPGPNARPPHAGSNCRLGVVRRHAAKGSRRASGFCIQRLHKCLAELSAHPGRLESAVLGSWARLERQVALCYRGLELRPVAEELRRMFRSAAAAGPASGPAR